MGSLSRSTRCGAGCAGTVCASIDGIGGKFRGDDCRDGGEGDGIGDFGVESWGFEDVVDAAAHGAGGASGAGRGAGFGGSAAAGSGGGAGAGGRTCF